MLQPMSKIGVLALAILFAALPVMACACAQCSDDGGRAGVLQEDGETVRGHGDDEIPSLLPGDRYAG